MLEEKDLQAIAQIIDVKLEPLKADVSELKSEVASLKTDVAILKTDVASLKDRTSHLENAVSNLKSETSELEETVKHNTLVTEGLVSKCVQLIGEAITMNAERFDRVDFDSIKRNYEVAVLYAQSVKEQMDSLVKKVDKIAS